MYFYTYKILIKFICNTIYFIYVFIYEISKAKRVPGFRFKHINVDFGVVTIFATTNFLNYFFHGLLQKLR